MGRGGNIGVEHVQLVDAGKHFFLRRHCPAARRGHIGNEKRRVRAISPCAGIRPRTAKRSRDRVHSDDELSAVWYAAESRGDGGAIIRLIALTGGRLHEVSGMRWTELDPGAFVLRRPGRQVAARATDRGKIPRQQRVCLGYPRLAAGSGKLCNLWPKLGRAPVRAGLDR
jgi:integrase